MSYLILVIAFCIVAVMAITTMVFLFVRQRKQALRAEREKANKILRIEEERAARAAYEAEHPETKSRLTPPSPDWAVSPRTLRRRARKAREQRICEQERRDLVRRYGVQFSIVEKHVSPNGLEILFCPETHSYEEKIAKHYKKKGPRGQLLEEEVNALRGHKRLVDGDGGTKVLPHLYASNKWENEKDHSHYNVRAYKVNRKNKRKGKRAYQDFFCSYNEDDGRILPLIH